MMRIRVADVAPVKDEIVMRNATRRTAPKGKEIAWIGWLYKLVDIIMTVSRCRCKRTES